MEPRSVARIAIKQTQRLLWVFTGLPEGWRIPLGRTSQRRVRESLPAQTNRPLQLGVQNGLRFRDSQRSCVSAFRRRSRQFCDEFNPTIDQDRQPYYFEVYVSI